MRSKNKKSSNSRSKSWEDRESRDMKRDNKRRRRKDDMAESSSNNPAWYASDAALLRDAASYPFSQPLGTPVRLAIHGHDPNGLNTWVAFPGVLSLKVVPTLGFSDNSYSPVNVAAKSIYSFIRHANSGHSNYDSPDMMIYLLAMSSIYSAINWAQRLYGYTTLYNQRNRYMPEALLVDNGVNFDSMKNNMANFRMALNVIINKVASLAVPANMTIFARYAFMYSNVYSEGLSVKDQVYQYVPTTFFQFGLDSQSKGLLTTTRTIPVGDITANLMLWSDVISMIDGMVEAVWEQEDFGIMSGDILKAYGDNIIKLTSLDEFYPIVPVYDEMVLEQMHNADIMPELGNLGVTQTTLGEYLVSKPYRKLSNPNDFTKNLETDVFEHSDILTLNADAPTPEMVIEATRLKVGLHKAVVDASNQWFAYPECGTEVVTGVIVTLIRNTGSLDHYYLSFNTGYLNSANADSTRNLRNANSFEPMLVARMFKYAPLVYTYIMDAAAVSDQTASGYFGMSTPFGNIDNFTILANIDIEKLHTAALLNMLNVPSIAKNAISKQ